MTVQPDNVLPFEADKPTVSKILVTPEMAQRWLDRNTRNRRVRPATVKKYARDMAAGRWHLTGEGIKFAPDGSLLDGQHRLMAIVQSGATVLLDVHRGIDPDAQRYMDTGRARTASDALTMKGERHTATLAAASRLALGFAADLPDPGKYDATHGEVEALIEQHPELRQAAEVACSLARRTDVPPAVVAYSYWRMSQVAGAQAAADFWVAAADKVGLSAGDPVIALTNRFAEARRGRERLTKQAMLSLIFRAWNARRAHKSLRILRVNSSSGGVVPVPELRP